LALVERLLSRFDERFPIEVAQIEDSLSAGDTTTAARLAHRLKGAAANISAPALKNVLQQIEDSARADRIDQIASRMAELNRQWRRFGTDKLASIKSTSTVEASQTDCSPAAQSS
jgi:HPt (histidine-containing phosphotransfer) domain-containing protein